MKNRRELPPIEKRITYAVHVNAKTPYELYLDDILVDNDYEDGNDNYTTELNPYLLSNGKHTLKIKYLPLLKSTDGLLHPKDVIASKDYKWNIFFYAVE